MNPEQLKDIELDECIDEHWKQVVQLMCIKIARQRKFENFEDLETTLRELMLDKFGPELAEEIIEYFTGIETGRERKITTIVGQISITDKQADYLGLNAYSRFSPKMEKNAMLICANESYQKAETDLAALTGIKISHSTLHRLVQRQDIELPNSALGVQEVALDGGKVRLRTEEKGQPCEWKDYNAVILNGVDCGAFFQDKQSLQDWVNCQKIISPFYCLGDGHPGIWNFFQNIGAPDKRIEILDWYHLKENLYKVGGSLKRIKQAKNLLWSGKVDETISLFTNLKKKTARNFCAYLEKHRHRIVDYQYHQLESVSSIGSGSIESVIKRIGLRIKLSGAQWNRANVNKILSLRCAYLNGALST